MKKKNNPRDRVVAQNFSLGSAVCPITATAVAAFLVFSSPNTTAKIIENSLDRIEGLAGDHPEVGAGGMRFLSPDLLEVTHINTKTPTENPESWNFATDGVFTAPTAASFSVTIDGNPVTTSVVGFRRRVLVARSGSRDVRIDNRLLLKLHVAAAAGATAHLETTGWQSTPTPEGIDPLEIHTATLDAARRSPAIHTNHGGYITGLPKQAMVGYYLGTAGEMDIPSTTFRIINTATGIAAHEGNLVISADSGFGETPAPYTKVMKADFTALDTPGSYALEVPGLGRSLPFTISPENSLYFARSYATGLLNQRCGKTFGFPHSRHGHAACHTAPSQIPTAAAEFKPTWDMIAACNNGWTGIAPRIVSAETQLYPILRQGAIDTTGGHHDAGDYSKYTINSAQLIHSLVFAADAFPNAAKLDNLGIPESGDGKSDLLQEALHEADYLAKLQDDDGGFFFLVYPKNRKYENNVLPQDGDSQVVWPKNTASTAASVGALADIASSPVFRAQYPAEAEIFLQKARAGWDFLLRAIETHGKDGAYQKLTHYGDLFGHNDELAWAAAAMFAATGDPACQAKLLEWYDPSDPQTIRWGWWSLYESYGCAARSYAFAVRSGKRSAAEMNATQLAKSEAIIVSRGKDVRGWTDQSAYGVSFDWATKRFSSAGWFFPVERAFDIVAADQIQPNPANIAAVLANINYEFGTNPLNLTYLTGCGLRNQQEIVHQFGENDDRRLPPSGIPIGSVQAGFSWTPQYQSELSKMTIPTDWATNGRYPFYDRWADTFNVTTEFVVAQQGKGLAAVAAIAASRPNAVSQTWNPSTLTLPTIQLTGLTDGYATAGQPFTATLSSPDGPDLSTAVVLWETSENHPVRTGSTVTIIPTRSARQWIEAEALTTDGKRLCARAEFGVKIATTQAPAPLDDTTVALYRFDSDWSDSSPNLLHLTAQGNPEITPLASGWATDAATNHAVRFHGNNDRLTVTIPDKFLTPLATPTPLTLEFRICPLRYTAYGKSNSPVACLSQSWAIRFGLNQNMWANPCRPDICADNVGLLTPADWEKYINLATWNKIRISRDTTGKYELSINDALVATGNKSTDFGGTGDWLLELGNFDGYLDDLRISGLPNHGAPPSPPADSSGSTGSTESTGSTGSTSSTGSTVSSDSTTTPTPETPLPAIYTTPFSHPFVTDAETSALYHFDGDLDDASGNGLHLAYTGDPMFVTTTNAQGTPNGYAIRFRKFGDALKISVPDALVSPGSTATDLTVETWILPRAYKAWGNDVASILQLHQNWDSVIGLYQDKWLTPAQPSIRCGTATITSQAEWSTFMQPGVWQHLQIVRTADGQTTIRVNGKTIKTAPSPNAWGRTNDWSLTIGNIDADMDEIRISRTARPPLAIDELEADTATIALYHFNGDATDSSPNALHLNATGNTTFDSSTTATSWMQNTAGSAVNFTNVEDYLTIPIPNSLISPGNDTTPITIEAKIFPRAWKAYGRGVYSILRLYQHWDSHIGFIQDKWLRPACPQIMVGSKAVLTNVQSNELMKLNQWNDIKICRTARKTTIITLNGIEYAEVSSPTHDARTNDWSLIIGNFDGLVDEVRISRDER